MKSAGAISKQVKQAINQQLDGRIFNYTLLSKDLSKKAIVQALSRASRNGEIVRMSKGKYYKPRKTRFGLLRPDEDEIIRSLTEKNGKPTGYLTGLALYNRLGLTTQIANELLIARKGRLPVKNIYGYQIRFADRVISITKKSIPLLQLLDVLRDINDIPDTTADKTVTEIVELFKKLTAEQWMHLLKLALQYNPATRALLGAIAEKYFPSQKTSLLMESLNPLTKYSIGVSKMILPNMVKWYIQ